MAVNLKRSGTALVFGAAGGVLDASQQPVALPSGANFAGVTSIQAGTILEAVGLVGGTIAQIMAPFTMPEIVDGVVDASAALLAEKLARRFSTQNPSGMFYTSPRHVSTPVGAYALPGGARAQAGATVPQPGVPRFS